MAASVSPPGYLSDAQRARRRFDWPLVGSAVALMLFGLMSLYSVGKGFEGQYFRKQIVNVLIGLIPFGLLAWVHPKLWRQSANLIYIVNILCLLAVMVFGKTVKGAERWIVLPVVGQFQPSEFAKIAVVLTLAAFYAHREEVMDRFSTFALSLLHVAIPALLIFKQPHLGAFLVIMVLWFAISLVAGVPLKFLGGILAAVMVISLAAIAIPKVRAKVLSGYQVQRLLGISSKEKDIQGKNYQTDRAEIAFGVGGAYGSGFMRGEQKQAGFIPEQQNDFIITVIGEEGGLVGTSLLLLTFGLFFYRVFLVMLNADEPYFRMLAAGIFAVLGFHMFVNIAMVLQLLPVVGLWLPFLSYGGTAMWLCMSCVGLLLGIRRRERPLLF